MTKILSNKNDIRREIIDKYDAFIFDMDGVLWSVDTPKPKAAELLHLLKDLKKQIFFATNNSLNRPQQYVEKIKRLNLGSYPLESIFCSSNSVALYFRQLGYRGKAYVIGPQALKDELSTVEGIEIVDSDIHNKFPTLAELAEVKEDPSIGAVVVGLDTTINYYKICYASLILNHRKDAIFVYTNADKRYPTNHSTLPGTGSLVSAIQAATDLSGVYVGKPSDIIIKEIERRYPYLKNENICIVGDNLLTDIAFGRKLNLGTVLVETGVHNRADVKKTEFKDYQPDFIVPSITNFMT